MSDSNVMTRNNQPAPRCTSSRRHEFGFEPTVRATRRAVHRRLTSTKLELLGSFRSRKN